MHVLPRKKQASGAKSHTAHGSHLYVVVGDFFLRIITPIVPGGGRCRGQTHEIDVFPTTPSRLAGNIDHTQYMCVGSVVDTSVGTGLGITACLLGFASGG